MDTVCPYCGCSNEACVPDVVARNAESYGGGNRNFNCLKCGKTINACVSVGVRVHYMTKTDKDSDWGSF